MQYADDQEAALAASREFRQILKYMRVATVQSGVLKILAKLVDDNDETISIFAKGSYANLADQPVAIREIKRLRFADISVDPRRARKAAADANGFGKLHAARLRIPKAC